jgi:hypothetical protein
LPEEKMIFPKKVIIAGRNWSVLTDKTLNGGEWDADAGEIRIGPHKSEEERMICFIHEVLEVILTMKNYRQESYPDENYLFIFTHRDLINIARDFYLALRPILPTKGKY